MTALSRSSRQPSTPRTKSTTTSPRSSPEHYGRNLDALRDCLTEMSGPVLISVVRNREEGGLSGFFDKLCVCLMVSVRENPDLDMEVVFESEEDDADDELYLLDEEAGLD